MKHVVQFYFSRCIGNLVEDMQRVVLHTTDDRILDLHHCNSDIKDTDRTANY